MITKDHKKMYFYNEFADQFDGVMNMYDVRRRQDIIFNEFLSQDISGKLILDAGCGTGWFSKEAVLRGANVVSLDVGENLLKITAQKCQSKGVVASALALPFSNNTFDIIISTEVIEHTPDPLETVKEMSRVLRHDGLLALTVPNKIWHPAIVIANILKIRPYEGYENWVGWRELKNALQEFGFSIEKMRGLHLFPFLFPFTYKFLTKIDRYGYQLGPIMLNICTLNKKHK